MEKTTSVHEFGKAVAVRERRVNDLHVTYTLFESCVSEDGGRIYSVVLDTEANGKTETVRAYDIRRNRSEAEELLRLLSDGIVTSCVLFEILDEIL